MTEQTAEERSPLEAFIEETHEELARVRTGLEEIRLLVTQSQGEVDKLAQRNAMITSQVHQLQAQFETIPREDIRATYETAQDTQQRLFTMRGQLEKLQSDEANLERYERFLVRTLSILEGGPQPADIQRQDGSGGETVIEKIIDAQEEERRKISRQVHDGPAQALSNFILQTEIALRLFDVDPDRAREELEELKDAAASTFSQVRDFIFDLRPMMLDDLGLVPTLRRYIEAFSEKTGLEISLVVTGSEGRLESHREVLCFRAIQDLLGNVRDHAQATQAKVSFFMDEQDVRVTVEDNGKGIPESIEYAQEGQDPILASLRDRIAQIGGEFELESAPDQGTRVSFTIPAG